MILRKNIFDYQRVSAAGHIWIKYRTQTKSSKFLQSAPPFNFSSFIVITISLVRTQTDLGWTESVPFVKVGSGKARSAVKKSLLIGFVFSCVALFLWVWIVFSPPEGLQPQAVVANEILFKNVKVLTMSSSNPLPLQEVSVLVRDGIIQKVEPYASLSKDLKSSHPLVIDGAGGTLLPGLIDAHVHVWDEAELAAYLAYGVTTLRNMSGLPFHLNLIKRIKEKEILSPELITTSPILNSQGPNFQANHLSIESPKQAVDVVRRLHSEGYKTIKVYSNLKQEVYQSLYAETQRLGLKITGHTPEGVRIEGMPSNQEFTIPFEDSLDKGFQTIEHVESIVWHGLRDQLDTNAMIELAHKIALSQTPVTATLVAHANLLRVSKTKGKYLEREGTDKINPLIKKMEADTYSYWSSSERQSREEPRAQFYLKATRILHEAGVPILAGSDAGIFTNIPGLSLHDELKLLRLSGLSNFAVIQTATVNAAQALGFDKLGEVKVGFKANLILVQGDPLQDLTTLEMPKGVLREDQWLDQSHLNTLKESASKTSYLRTLIRVLPILLNCQ